MNSPANPQLSSRMRPHSPPTPVASTEAVGTKQAADAGRLDRRGGRQQSLPSEICPTEPGVSGQRRLSVGGAMTRFRCRSLEFSRRREATGTRKAARGCAATVGFRQSELPTPVVAEAVGTKASSFARERTFANTI
jgi:hypothetical protein